MLNKRLHNDYVDCTMTMLKSSESGPQSHKAEWRCQWHDTSYICEI